MTWRVEPTVIDEWVPAPRDAFCVMNEIGEVADDSTCEDYDSAVELAEALNAEEG